MQGEQQAITFEQKVNILQNITLFPALTIMVFLRRKIGYRFLDLMKIEVMVVLLWAYSAFSSITSGPAAGAIIFLFALAVLIAASIERRLRWREIKRGISWHTYSRGISWFSSFLPLSEIVVKRFIDPAAALIVGIALFFLFRPLGLYFILSAVCLFLFETIDYQKQIDRMLDQLDNLVESEVVSENVEYFQSGGVARARPVEETAGIPTGTDPDLAAAIERRRSRGRQSQSPVPTRQPLNTQPAIAAVQQPAQANQPPLDYTHPQQYQQQAVQTGQQPAPPGGGLPIEQELKEMLRSNPEDTRAHFELAQYYESQNRLDEAWRGCNYLMRVLPNDKEVAAMHQRLQARMQTRQPPQSPQADRSQVQASTELPPQNIVPQSQEVDPDLAAAIAKRQARQPMQPTQESQQPPLPQNAATQAQDVNQSQQGIPIIESPNDPAFTALPSGAQFVTPDGKTRIKK